MSTPTDRVLGASNNRYEAIFTDKKDNSQMDPMDFIKLLVAQMQNQDFSNPMDNSEMVSQMTQFSNMQMMQEMASYSKTNYAMSLVGKTVTASRYTVGGNLDTTTGVVQKVSLVDNEYVIYVDGKKYSLSQIMEVQNSGSTSGSGSSSTVNPQKFNLALENLKSDSVTIKWQVPTEDELAAKNLKYTVYYSEESDFGTVEKVEAGTQAGGKDLKSTTELDVSGLKPGTQYYFNVVVTDENGAKTVYKPVSVRTYSS